MPVPKIYGATAKAVKNLRYLTGPIRHPQEYVDHVLKSDYWTQRSSIANLPVEYSDDTATGGLAYTEAPDQKIVLGKNRTNINRVADTDVWVILHELAHFLVPETVSDGHHGPRFVQEYIGLVRCFLGAHAASELLAQCKAHGIRLNYRKVSQCSSVH